MSSLTAARMKTWVGLIQLSFATRCFDLAFEFNCKLVHAGLVRRLHPAQGLVKKSSLMLGPIRFARNAAEIALIESGPRRVHEFDHVALDGEHHRRNAALLNCSRCQRHRLMTKARRGNQQGGLNFVMLQTVDEFGERDIDQQRSVRNESAEAPECRIQLTDNAIGGELKQTRQRNLNVYILLNESGIVAAS